MLLQTETSLSGGAFRDFRNRVLGAGTDTSITYTLDEPSHLNPYITRAGNVTTQVTVAGAKTTTVTNDYDGNQLASVKQTVTQNGASASTPTNYYAYDDLGNLDCITTDPSRPTCSISNDKTPSGSVLADYSYDSLDRLAAYRSYSAGTTTDSATYTYDALDRVTKEAEFHHGSGERTTRLSYLGLTSAQSEEVSSGSSDATKVYSYDAWGLRLAMTKNPDATEPQHYTYGYDVHGSVSQLLSSTGATEASYGYDPYGQEDTTLTKGDAATDQVNLLNPYRYSAKRYDTGSETLDMGARRFSPDVSRFIQQDLYRGALSDLSLSTDPLVSEPLQPRRRQPRELRRGRRPRRLHEWIRYR